VRLSGVAAAFVTHRPIDRNQQQASMTRRLWFRPRAPVSGPDRRIFCRDDAPVCFSGFDGAGRSREETVKGRKQWPNQSPMTGRRSAIECIKSGRSNDARSVKIAAGYQRKRWRLAGRYDCSFATFAETQRIAQHHRGTSIVTAGHCMSPMPGAREISERPASSTCRRSHAPNCASAAHAASRTNAIPATVI
jgi:hypothetical protein